MKYTIKDIAEIGIFVGIAIILNIHIFSIHVMPNSGSISFTLIPLFIIALRKSWWKTFLACGIIYGLIACAMDGYGFHTYPLDYLLAYGSIMVVSFFRSLVLKRGKMSILYLIIAVIIATMLRMLFSTISGVVNYGMDFLGSFIYNSIYISITGAVSLAVILLLLKPLKIVNERYSSAKEIQ